MDSIGSNHNVNIRFHDVAQTLRANLAPRLIDFLEIAAYVFTADCSASRGEWRDGASEEPWGRDMAFLIGVREPEFWNSTQVRELLEDILSFLSNDRYSFCFVPLQADRPSQTPYFKFGDKSEWPFHEPDRVIMFSGGLDSMAGTVDFATSGRKAVLVSHRPVSTIDARQKRLFREINQRFPNQFIHVPVWVNKNENFSKESTQRTRSFLFTALGTLVAESIEAAGIRFYENGVLSVNLPMAQEALRARASRTTHPKTLHLLSLLAGLVTGRGFILDNPFLFKTKTEVVKLLSKHNALDFIPLTCSCSHLIFQTSSRRHCGLCSQCIDRRFAMVGAKLLRSDPESDYVHDVFIGHRQKEVDRAIAVDFTRHGIELANNSINGITQLFNTEIARAVFHEPNRRNAAAAIIAMYQRHGQTVREVLAAQVAGHAEKLIAKTLDKTSLLALALGQEYLPDNQDLRKNPTRGGDPENLKRAPEVQAVLEQLGQVVEELRSFSGIGYLKHKKTTKQKVPSRRDSVIFAAITRDMKGLKYCIYLDKHRVSPKWASEGPNNYSESYKQSKTYQKKIQDEKARAKNRLNKFLRPVVLGAFVKYLPTEFEDLSSLYNSRNSPDASEKVMNADHVISGYSA